MDKPADLATPFIEVYQSFPDDLVLHDRKPSTIHPYRYNIVRFEAKRGSGIESSPTHRTGTCAEERDDDR